jgi:tRNA threonylcarbamoyladenosine biosynthesis protein TsaB
MGNDGFSIAIDTCVGAGSLALIISGEVQAEAVGLGRSGRSTDVIFAISELIENHSLSPVGLEALYLTRGPGSFTGVRTGLSVAKGLQAVLPVRLQTCTVMEAMSVGCGKEGCYTAMFAGRGAVAFQKWADPDREELGSRETRHSVSTIVEFAKLVNGEEAITVVAEPRLLEDTESEFLRLLEDANTRVISPRESVAKLAWRFISSSQGVNGFLEAVYTREFDTGGGV